MDISILVKTLRQRLGLTQEQFAREVGVTFSTLSISGKTAADGPSHFS